MFITNLNRLFQIVKMSGFGILCNLIFHSLVLSLLVYWSFTSRHGNFNQFWTENQLLLATICQGAIVLFFREFLFDFIQFNPQSRSILLANLLRGALFTFLIAGSLIFTKTYDFLGFTAQANLTFFSSYAWIFRALILALFIFCTELFIHGIVMQRLPASLPYPAKVVVASLTLIAIYGIWFEMSWGEALTLFMLCLLLNQFWEACGFLTAFFVLTHAVLSLPWMGAEFSGLAQLKTNQFEARFLEAPSLQLTLFVLFIAFKVIPFYYFKRKRGALTS